MRIYPIYNKLTEANLVSANVFAPARIPESEEYTQLLRFGHPVDLIGISMSLDMLERGLVDTTDVIDAGPRLDKIYFKSTIGKTGIKVLDVLHMSAGVFKSEQTGEYGKVFVNLKTPIAGGILQVKGSLNMELGTLEVNGEVSDVEGIELIGFSLLAERSNPNRRPRVI